MPKVLLVDRSGRGHAFADLFTRTNSQVEVYYAPGCAGISHPRIHSLPECSLNELDTIIEAARDVRPDFVLIGSAPALAAGLVDRLEEAGFTAIGPDRTASLLEASKVYTKRLCTKYSIPVAGYQVFESATEAIDYVKSVNYGVVVKADGLCTGMGSIVCESSQDAIEAIHKLMIERQFGDAGKQVVVERRLAGIEFSFFAILDGESFLLLPTAMDYKKSDNGNKGMNCGGTGSVSPHPLESQTLRELATEQILIPVMRMLKEEHLRYTGVIYLGTMLVGNQFYLLEINIRFGDPEAEVILPRVRTDWYEVCTKILERRLSEVSLDLDSLTYVDVVCGQGRTRQIVRGKNKGWYAGWPQGRFGRHYKISGLENMDPREATCFLGEAFLHPDKGLVSDGGRVLHVVGIGDGLQSATANVYRNIGHVSFSGCSFRTDIGRIMPWEVGPLSTSASGIKNARLNPSSQPASQQHASWLTHGFSSVGNVSQK